MSIFRKKTRDSADSVYYDKGNGWWSLPKAITFISPTYAGILNGKPAILPVPADRAAQIQDGMRRWAELFTHPLVHIQLEFTNLPTEANVIISFSKDKPRVIENGKEKEVLAKTEPINDGNGSGKNFHRCTMQFFIGVSGTELIELACHEAGHGIVGIRRHAPYGLMGPNVDNGFPNEWDIRTALVAYEERRKFGLEPPLPLP